MTVRKVGKDNMTFKKMLTKNLLAEMFQTNEPSMLFTVSFVVDYVINCEHCEII